MVFICQKAFIFGKFMPVRVLKKAKESIRIDLWVHLWVHFSGQGRTQGAVFKCIYLSSQLPSRQAMLTMYFRCLVVQKVSWLNSSLISTID